MTYSVHTTFIDTYPSETDKKLPLGRNVRHDSRSRMYAFPTKGLTPLSVAHVRRIQILDQNLTGVGSCTANAGLGALGCDPFYTAMGAGNAFKKAFPKGWTEDSATTLYSAATKIDRFKGEYPPTDTGSDGLSVATVLKGWGLISGYQHTFSLDDMLRALSVTVGIIGINWYSSFDTPAKDGRVVIQSDATIRGGHELLVREVDVPNRLIWWDNSWGAVWGKAGRCCASFETVERLLAEDGDFTVFCPPTAPAPIPSPVPTPIPAYTPADLVMYQAAKGWAYGRGIPA